MQRPGVAQEALVEDLFAIHTAEHVRDCVIFVARQRSEEQLHVVINDAVADSIDNLLVQAFFVRRRHDEPHRNCGRIVLVTAATAAVTDPLESDEVASEHDALAFMSVAHTFYGQQLFVPRVNYAVAPVQKNMHGIRWHLQCKLLVHENFPTCPVRISPAPQLREHPRDLIVFPKLQHKAHMRRGIGQHLFDVGPWDPGQEHIGCGHEIRWQRGS